MRNKAYQNSHNHYPCVFCGIENGTVVGHHVRIKGTCGTGLKPSDIQVIPVCYVDHAHCHDGLHTIERQTEKLLQYWLLRMTEKYGRAKAIERIGVAIWDGLQ